MRCSSRASGIWNAWRVFRGSWRGFPEARFVFAGDGPLRGEIEARIRTLGLERNVILTGFHPHPEQLIALADICLLASAREGLPRVLMQYLAGGRPVVAADLPSHRRSAAPRRKRARRPFRDLEGLADAVITLLDDPARRARLARGAAMTELSEWDAARMGERLEAVYADVIRERMPHRVRGRAGGGDFVNALLALAVLSLMLPIRMETGFILVRPFEFLIALGMLGWPLIAARRGVRVPVGLLLLLPYFLWHVASATVGGPRNTAREGLQVLVVTMFAFLLAQEAPRLDMKRLSRRLLLGMAAIAPEPSCGMSPTATGWAGSRSRTRASPSSSCPYCSPG